MNTKTVLRHVPVDSDAYEQLFRKCTQTNLLQSIAYGNAKGAREKLRVERMAILDGRSTVAIYQALVKGAAFPGRIARINRGPLYLGDSIESIIQIQRSLYDEWVIRKKCYLLTAPNLPEGSIPAEELNALGFRSVGQGWQSGWVHLAKPEGDLRKGLHQKWRNMLNKAEKMNIGLSVAHEEDDLDYILRQYSLFMAEHGFKSTPAEIIRDLFRFSPEAVHAVVARKEGEYLGAVVITKHADSATYLVGITSPEGRKVNANYLLLWNALMHCSQSGCHWFDLGGIDDVNTPGIAHFKKGLGGSIYRLIGEFEAYRGLLFFLLGRLQRWSKARLEKTSIPASR